jgi:hypothetical protein
MGAAVAIIMRKQRDVVYVFQGARATSPETARDPGELGVEQDLIFRGLVRRAVLRDAGNGRYYFDQPSWSALSSTRHRLAFVIASIVLIMIAFGVLVTTSRI